MPNDQKRKPILPIYLDQSLVFDYLAMLNDGLAHVSRVVKNEQASQSHTNSANAGFGLGQALSNLISLNIQGNTQATKTDINDAQTTAEKVHTPSSLLYKLIGQLESENLIIPPQESKSGDIVHFQARLKLNPILDFFETMRSVISLQVPLLKLQTNDPSKLKKVNKETESTLEQIDIMKTLLLTDTNIDLLTESIKNTECPCILTLRADNFRSSDISSLEEGEFGILAKIIEHRCKEDAPISFTRKASISKLDGDYLNNIFLEMAKIKTTVSDVNLPEVKFELEPEAIVAIPFAIYL